MKLVLLGTTGYHPSDHRQTMCLMVPEYNLVLDAGTAMYRVRPYLTSSVLDICLTHTHLDHVIGLTFLFSLAHETPLRTARVHGDAEKLAALDQHLLSQHLFPAPLPIEWCPLADTLSFPNGGRLTWFPLDHPGGSLGYRLDSGRGSMAYVTDTSASPSAPYVEQIRKVDLLIHECNFPDGWDEQAKLTGHSCLTNVLQVARKADVGRLVLVHMSPILDDQAFCLEATARKIFPATSFGTDHMTIDF